MKIKHKNYPHPVLAPFSDDIQNSPMYSNVEIKWDKSYYYLEFEFSLFNDVIAEFIKSEKANILLHVECGKTFYRKVHKIEAKQFIDNEVSDTITIPASCIKDTTEVSVFVCSSSEIAKYMPEGLHPDYGESSFVIENGDFVAVWKTYRFDLYQDYDPIKKTDSIISFQRDDDRDTGEIKVLVNTDKLTAFMPRDMHQLYSDLSADRTKEDVLMAMLGVPVLMEGLAYIKENTLEDEGMNLSSCRRHRWFRSLEKKLLDLSIDIKSQDNMFVVAQKIFENPCKKAGKAFEQIDERQY